jgi:copper ion binding protein
MTALRSFLIIGLLGFFVCPCPGCSRAAFAGPSCCSLATHKRANLAQPVEGTKTKGISATYGRVYLHVDGMTCDACVTKVKKALHPLDGISEVVVNLERKSASATLTSSIRVADLIKTIETAGFKVNIIPTEKVCLKIMGMTCEKCVQGITSAVSKIVGVQGVDVELKTGIACVTRETGKVKDEVLVETVSEAGGTKHRFLANLIKNEK